MSRLDEGLRANRLVRRERAEGAGPASPAPPADSLDPPKAGKQQPDTLTPAAASHPEADGLAAAGRTDAPGDTLDSPRPPAATFSTLLPREERSGKEEEGLLQWLRCSARRYPGLDRQEELF